MAEQVLGNVNNRIYRIFTKSVRDGDWKEIMSQSREIQSPNRDLPLP